MYLVRISQQKATISPHGIHCVFLIPKKSIYRAGRAESLNVLQTELSLRRPGFDLRRAHVRFVVNKVALGRSQ